MPLKLVRLNESSPLLGEMMALYTRAFPANERRPLGVLLRDGTGAAEVLAVLKGDDFIGLAILLTWQDITHILYFAVLEELRGRGYGGEILRLIRDAHPNHRVIADLEAPFDEAPNLPERQRRMAFYERNGFSQTEIRYAWRGERYVIVSMGGDVSEDEFEHFWEYFYDKQTGYNY